MTVKPMLGDWEIPRIDAIQSLEQRDFVELPIPGAVGSLFQDMNTRPSRLVIKGSLYGEEARNQFLDEIRGKFREGTPVTFVGDIATATEIQYVIIETLQMEESGNLPDQIEYHIVLKESPPPPPPPDPLGGLDTDLLDQAGGFLDSVTGALDALGSVPELSDPTAPLTGTLSGVEGVLGDLTGIGSVLTDLFGGDE